MKSKWSEHKAEAIKLRKSGRSLPFIHHKLGIPKSTLSNWLKDVELTTEQKDKLRSDWQQALVKARLGAAAWHKNQKTLRLQIAESKSLELLSLLDLHDKNIIELALAFLYLGEGTKTKDETGMGSSNPIILKFFVNCLTTIYHVPLDKIKCELHLRADQNPVSSIKFWSNELGIDAKNFNKPYLDKRTTGQKTYESYKGVCLVRCGRVEIQRKLVYIAKHFCSEINARVQ